MPEFTKQALNTCHGWIMGPHDSSAYDRLQILASMVETAIMKTINDAFTQAIVEQL